MPGTRYLGIDYGTRRVGLAISDPEGKIASPLRTLPWPGSARKCAEAILAQVAEDYDVDEFVVGLPLYMHGGEGKQTDPVKQLAREIQEQSERPVHFWDERLTTRAAEVALNSAGLTRAKKKARVDQVAAQIMLQSFLDCRQQESGSEADTE